MLIVRYLAVAASIADPDVRRLVTRRYGEICNGETYDYDRHGQLIVVEPGDTTKALEQESGCRILRSLFDEVRFGDPDFAPSFEALEEHPGCYEMVFILNDDGFGVDFFIPKQAGVDPELLAMCAQYAVPAHPEITST
jgi:hypothetical protein